MSPITLGRGSKWMIVEIIILYHRLILGVLIKEKQGVAPGV